MDYEYEAVIVLAGGVKPDQTLTTTSRLRVDKGIELYKNNRAPVLVFSGHYSFMFPNPHNLSESRTMRNHAANAGVFPENIVTEDKSKDTLGNAYFTKVEVVLPRQWARLAVVTSDFHIKRTKYLFTKVFGPEFQIDCLAVPTPKKWLTGRKALEQSQLAQAHKWLDSIPDGDHKAIGRLLFTKHPGYAHKGKSAPKA